MKSLFFAKSKTPRNPGFFAVSIVEKYAICRFVQNPQTRAHRAIPQIKVVARKPRFFCNTFFYKNEKIFWRISAFF